MVQDKKQEVSTYYDQGFGGTKLRFLKKETKIIFM